LSILFYFLFKSFDLFAKVYCCLYPFSKPWWKIQKLSFGTYTGMQKITEIGLSLILYNLTNNNYYCILKIRMGNYRFKRGIFMARVSIVSGAYNIADAFAYEKALNFALTRIKRLYKDRGYSYNNYMTKNDLHECVRLAPETCGKTTLFTVMKGFGLIG
jgi:hypothetical protein